MTQSTTCIIVLLIMLFLYASEKLPLCITALLGMLSMGIFGIISWSDVFSGMGNSVVLLMIGMSIIGESYFTTGLADKLGKAMVRLENKISEKLFNVVLYCVGAITSAFSNALVIVPVLFPLIDIISSKSGGKIRRKQAYLPAAIGTVFGSNITTIGSSSMMLAIGLLASSSYAYTISFFEPFAIGIPGILVGLIFYATFGWRMQDKCFDFPDVPVEIIEEDTKKANESVCRKSWKSWFVAIVTVASVIAMASGFNIGAVAMLSATLVMLTKCVEPKHAFRNASWETVFVVVGSLGFASGFAASGAGEIVANAIISLFGSLGQSPYVMCVASLLMAMLLSEVMSNGAAVAITVPICLALAESLGTSGTPFVLAAAIGANLAIATPISVVQITMTGVAGYRFKDYFRVGGFINLFAFLATAIALKLVYFM